MRTIDIPTMSQRRIDPLPEGSVVTVLIVDDVDVLRDALADFLCHTTGIVVVGMAADGIEAIDRCREVNPDVVIMDMRMPRMDGTAATKEITASGPPPRVLMLSAYDDESLVRQALSAGAWGFLLKDAAPQEIAQAVIATAQGRNCFSEELLKLPIDQLLLDLDARGDTGRADEREGRHPSDRESQRPLDAQRFRAERP
jgi:DNA-binding NarL/FixJ family response regulator